MEKISLGFSPCPNDTFIFDALVNQLIDTEGLSFDYLMEDVETLNEWALSGKLMVTKLSYGVVGNVLNHYKVLNSGGALGMGVGPLLVSHKKDLLITNESSVLLPGKNTTAHALFSIAYPQVTNKQFGIFNSIENAVLANTVDAGVIIHENRFTYQAKGLHLVADLGNIWETKFHCPIPLGGIVVKRNLPNQLQLTINRLIKKSIEYAKQNYPEIGHFISCNAQEMSEEVMRKHIDLYVNEFSVCLGKTGQDAVLQLLKYAPGNNIHFSPDDVFTEVL
ncbi:MAG: 1,4-dihydroxy-6-naphthoate synthase [Chitinophagaceae bacterium]